MGGSERNPEETRIKKRNVYSSDIKMGSKKNHNSETTHPKGITDVSSRLKSASTAIYVLLKMTNIFFVPIFIYRAFQKAHKVPPVEDEVLKLSVKELTEKIRHQELTCVDVIQRYITRIKLVNSIINAIIDERFELALKEAEKVDELVKKLKEEDFEQWKRLEDQYPLLGVPFTVKGSLDLNGLRNSSGVVSRINICQKDAVVVALAKKAGAIPLLTSSVPELCMNWETNNTIIGTTNNPHNTLRTCGGSSGGEASLMASGASLIGLGSDIGGSLRLPAHYCGVFGHKPTPGTVSVEGHYPSCSNMERWKAAFAVGPMARYAGDLKIFLKAICNEEFRDKLKLDKKLVLRDVRLYYIDDLKSLLTEKVNSDCIENLQKAIKHLETVCGCSAIKLDTPLLNYTPVLASSYLLDIEGVDSLFKGENCDGVYSELFRLITGRSEHTLMAILYGLLKKAHNRVSKTTKKEIEDCVLEVKSTLTNTIGRNGVILLPCFPTEAHPHKDVIRKPFNSGYLSLFNAIGFPVTSCPVGKTKDGLPVGIQIAGLPYNDNLTLEIARELEKAFGGWIQP